MILRRFVSALLACSPPAFSDCGCREDVPQEPEPRTRDHEAELGQICYRTLAWSDDGPDGPFLLMDVDGDGVSDLVESGLGSIMVRLGLASGGFGATGAIVDVDGPVYALQSGDMNGDGIGDVVVVIDRAAVQLFGDGAGLLLGPETTLSSQITSPLHPRLALADADADGDTEMIVGMDKEVLALYLDTEGTISESISLLRGPEIQRMDPIELDGDPGRELLVKAGILSAIEPSAEVPVRWSATSPPSYAIADVDRDGIDEIVVARDDAFTFHSPAEGSMMEVGRLVPDAADPRPTRPTAFADVDGDGMLDFLAASSSTFDESAADSCGIVEYDLGTIDIWLANGRSSWLEHEVVLDESGTFGAFDLDGDLRPDIVLPGGRVALGESCST